ncbi:MAG: prepilin-type N-terminal cleavage/methylation domain-containing protein [Desulfuromonadaceae bacterium]|nr:prepilin-type N-terminal cleavage/methylation domain-containing protein [Desulfuromonadaceae bacterium]
MFVKLKFQNIFDSVSSFGHLMCPTQSQQVTVRNSGFTMVELIVITAILAVLAMMAMPAYNSYLISAKNAACVSDIRVIEKAISAYLLENNTTVPAATLGEMGIVSPLDPWKRQYEYQLVVAGSELEDSAGNPLNTDYDLYSKGENGLSIPAFGHDAENKDDIARSNDGVFVGVRP